MRNTIRNNFRRWNDQYPWSAHGDEWNGMARSSGVEYDTWKRTLVDTFLRSNITRHSTVVEIAPGFGRWAVQIAPLCGELILVDLSPKCIAVCREKLSSYAHVRYHVNDGMSLPGDLTERVDLIWSFDSFVHMEREVIAAYLTEFERTLVTGGKAIIHHAARAHAALALAPLRQLGPLGRQLYQLISMGKVFGHDGWRSDVSNRFVVEAAAARGLRVVANQQTWGAGNRCGVQRFGDYITTMEKLAKPE